MTQKQINESLVFDDISRILISLKKENKQVNLGLAAAYCLDCLIKAQGQIVSQDTLIEEGWRKHGFEVSPNNVRKVISQLRNAFKKLEESPDLLVTVPKLGYRLHFHVYVDSIEPEDNLSDASLEPHFDRTFSTKVMDNKPSHTYIYRWGGILLLNVVLAISYFFITKVPSLSQAYYKPFTSFSVKEKNLFVDQRMLDKPDFIQRSVTLLVASPFWIKDQVDYNWIYLNVVVDPKVHSFFLCDRAITEKNLKCTSRVFVEE